MGSLMSLSRMVGTRFSHWETSTRHFSVLTTDRSPMLAVCSGPPWAHRVDLVPKDHLHWVIKDRVLAEARALYAA